MPTPSTPGFPPPDRAPCSGHITYAGNDQWPASSACGSRPAVNKIDCIVSGTAGCVAAVAERFRAPGCGPHRLRCRDARPHRGARTLPRSCQQAPLPARLKSRHAATYDMLTSIGDLAGDGRTDLLARTPAGELGCTPSTAGDGQRRVIWGGRWQIDPCSAAPAIGMATRLVTRGPAAPPGCCGSTTARARARSAAGRRSAVTGCAQAAGSGPADAPPVRCRAYT